MRSEPGGDMKTAVRAMWIAFLLVAATAHADPPAGGDSKPAEGKVDTQRPVSAGSKKTPAKPAGSFTPSEKVGADSAVSFPVDI